MTKSELIEQLENLIEDTERLSGKDEIKKLVDEFCRSESDYLLDEFHRTIERAADKFNDELQIFKDDFKIGVE